MNLRERFNRDGYVVVPDVVRDIEGAVTRLSPTLHNIFNQDIDKYKSCLSMLAKSKAVNDLFSRRRVIEIVNELGIDQISFPSQPVLHVMSPDLKIPKGYYGTDAHQDWPSVQGSLDMITVWIALTNVDDFPIEIIPGSHLKGLRKGKSNGSVLKIPAKDKDFIPLTCKQGDAIFLSGFVIHRTGKGNGLRAAVSQRFDNINEPTFFNRLYPCAQKRIVDREVKWKPTLKQIQDIYA